MTRWTRLLFDGLEVDIYLIALFKRRENFILFIAIVKTQKAFCDNGNSLKSELLVAAHVDDDFSLLRKAVLVAEYRNEAAENGLINLHFTLCQMFLFGNFIGRRESRVALDFRVVKDCLFVLENNGVAYVFNIGNNLFYLVLFIGCKIFGVCTGIGKVALLVKLLHDSEAIRHGHLVLLTEQALKL